MFFNESRHPQAKHLKRSKPIAEILYPSMRKVSTASEHHTKTAQLNSNQDDFQPQFQYDGTLEFNRDGSIKHATPRSKSKPQAKDTQSPSQAHKKILPHQTEGSGAIEQYTKSSEHAASGLETLQQLLSLNHFRPSVKTITKPKTAEDFVTEKIADESLQDLVNSLENAEGKQRSKENWKRINKIMKQFLLEQKKQKEKYN